MKNIFWLMLAMAAGSVWADAMVTVNSVTQNWPWDSRVKIGYTIDGSTSSTKWDVSSVKLTVGWESQTLKTVALSGDLNGLADGTHELVWNPALDTVTGWTNLVNATFAIEIAATPKPLMPEYLVVDLSSGSDSALWPVTGVDSLDPTAEEYKTTKLVLKRIRAGEVMVGSPTNEPLRIATYEDQGKVTLTNDYYLGVYELTQRQYELMTGTAGASGQGGAYPRYNINWTALRGAAGTIGARWPASSAVTSGSLMDALRTKAALPSGVPSDWKFDLPTSAQWEYACRAGTTSAWNDGSEVSVVTQFVSNANGSITTNCYDAALERLGWYAGNAGGKVHKVGLKAPNRFGLYDMHGNVWEMCLDVIYYGHTPALGTEPRGYGYKARYGIGDTGYADSGASYHVVRGGSYTLNAPTYYDSKDPAMAVGICRAAARCRAYVSDYNYIGCRIAVRYSDNID